CKIPLAMAKPKFPAPMMAIFIFFSLLILVHARIYLTLNYRPFDCTQGDTYFKKLPLLTTGLRSRENRTSGSCSVLPVQRLPSTNCQWQRSPIRGHRACANGCGTGWCSPLVSNGSRLRTNG